MPGLKLHGDKLCYQRGNQAQHGNQPQHGGKAARAGGSQQVQSQKVESMAEKLNIVHFIGGKYIGQIGL